MIAIRRQRDGLLTRAGLAFAVTIAAFAGLAPAQEPNPTEALASKQQMVRDRVSQLVDRMYRLAEALNEAEPENAAKLRAALNETKERLIELNAELAVTQLRDGKLDDATTTQEQLLADLNEVLEVVLAQPDNDEERRNEIDRLERQREELNRLIDEQKQHVEETQNAAANAERAAAFGRVAEAVQRMFEQQQGLSEQTRSAAAGEGEAPTDAQKELGEQAEKTADDLPKLAEGGAEESFNAAKNASEALDAASKAMSDAAKTMSEGDPAAAGEQQQEAEEQLRRALHELKTEQERLTEKTDTARMAEAQRETQGETKRLAEDMSGQGSQQGEGGEQEGGQQPGGEERGGQQQGGEQSGGQQGGEQQPSPGSDRVQQAQQDMGQGAEELEQERMEEAEEHQQQALEELQQARRELEQSLEQLRREEQLDALTNLQERLQAILTRQKRVNETTTDLNVKPAQSWERADELKLAEVVEAQTTNLDETRQALHILREDATTVAFPSVIEQVAEDMDAVVQRLTDRKLGALTQRIQGDIVETLEELLAAIERQQSELEQQEQQPGEASGDQAPPLIPTSAELKLLKQSQLRVNRRTAVIAEVGQEDTDAATREARVLSDRQKELADLAREMQSRMSGEAP